MNGVALGRHITGQRLDICDRNTRGENAEVGRLRAVAEIPAGEAFRHENLQRAIAIRLAVGEGSKPARHGAGKIERDGGWVEPRRRRGRGAAEVNFPTEYVGEEMCVGVIVGHN